MTALTPSEVLSKAADLIEPEGAWTQYAYARTEKGRVIGPEMNAARCWCMVGALLREHSDEVVGVMPFVERVLGLGDVTFFNDAPERTQAEAVTTLREAANLARSEGQ